MNTKPTRAHFNIFMGSRHQLEPCNEYKDAMPMERSDVTTRRSKLHIKVARLVLILGGAWSEIPRFSRIILFFIITDY